MGKRKKTRAGAAGAGLRRSVLALQQERCHAAVGFGDDPDFPASARQAVRGENAKAFLHRQIILALIGFGKVAPIAGDMAAEQFKAVDAFLLKRFQCAGGC